MKTKLSTNTNRNPGSRYMHAVAIIAAFAVASVAGAQDIRATVNGDFVNFPDIQPIMIQNRVMVPVRGVFEHMNSNVEWDSNSRTVVAQRGTDTIRLPVNSYYATVNGRQVNLDSPAKIVMGRTMVPLRFLSEALGGTVDWVASVRTVEINTMGVSNPWQTPAGYTAIHMNSGTVIPFSLNQKLSSNGSSVGDKFTANLETGELSSYQGIPNGAVLEGHVDVVRAKIGDTPGVLGLAFDRVKLPDGQSYKVHGTLIGLDSNSVNVEGGRIVAKPGTKNDNLKWVGYGAGGGALIAILTKENVLTTSLIGGALGYLFGEIQKDPSKARNVTSDIGTKFGVKLTRELTYQVAIMD